MSIFTIHSEKKDCKDAACAWFPQVRKDFNFCLACGDITVEKFCTSPCIWSGGQCSTMVTTVSRGETIDPSSKDSKRLFAVSHR